jgi:hypothetical protein
MGVMIRTYEHSGTSATHISLDMSCRSHPSISAFAWFKYSRRRILSPLPHVTEHTLHSEYSVTPHSATGIQLFQILSISLHYLITLYQLLLLHRISQTESSIFWEDRVLIVLIKNCMSPIPNGFQDRTISLYSTLYTAQTSNMTE